MNPTKLIATYSRVSTSTQEEQQTIKTQLNILKEHAEKHGYKIVKEYIDDGWSGDTLVRPSLDKLRQDAKDKIWEGVLIYDPDRLARRYSYQELVMDELKEAGIEVMFVTIPAPKNSEDKILHGVRGLFAEYERTKIAERFRLGKLRKAREGHLLVSEPLYGYNYIPKRDHVHGYYEINEGEARVVRMLFDWVDQRGYTLRKIVKELQSLGIKPRRSKRGVWNTSTLSHLFKNKAYIGQARWGSSYAVTPEKPTSQERYRKIKKSSRKIKPEGEWVIIPVPPIISKEVFDRVVQRLRTNFLLSQRNTKNQYLLAGKIRCVCGRTRAGEGPQKGKHLYYRCTDRVLNHPLPRTCLEKGIRSRDLDAAVWERLSKLMVVPELLSKQAERWLNAQRNGASVPVANIALMEREVNKLKSEEDRYHKAYGAGVFTVEELKKNIDPVRERISSLEIQIAKTREMQRSSEMLPVASKDEIESFAREAAKLLKDLSFETKKAIVMNTVEKVVATREEAKVYGFIPVTNINVFTSYRHRRSSQRRQIDAF